jgi:hypothetical protein
MKLSDAKVRNVKAGEKPIKLSDGGETDFIVKEGMKIIRRQKPPDRHDLNSTETNGDGLIGPPGNNGPFRHRRLAPGLREGARGALFDTGMDR